MRKLEDFPFSSVLVTGASGFVGKNLIHGLVALSNEIGHQTAIRAVVRTVPSWLRDLHSSGSVAEVIVSDFDSPFKYSSDVDLVFHCATPASADLNSFSPRVMFELNVKAMQWVLDNPYIRRDKPIVVFTSSGAVYGPQPEDMPHMLESYLGGPDVSSTRSAYAEGKRVAEFLLCEAGARGVVNPRIARLFAFSGLGLPLDRHFAIGNFVRDARDGREIHIRGTGMDVRSYLDSRDMVDWLVAVATRGEDARPYNIGSSQEISIKNLAETVATRSLVTLGRSVSIVVENRTSLIDGASRYVPSVERICTELHVSQRVNLESSIDAMLTQKL